MLKEQTVGQYLEHWLKFYCAGRLAPNTIRGYRVNIYNHIIPNIGSIQLCDLMAEDIDELYYILRSKGLSSTSVIYVHAVLRKSLNTAMKRRLISENVVNYVDPPRREKYDASFINAVAMQRLLNGCRHTAFYMPILFALSLGLRRGELLGIMWSDINFAERTIKICRSATYVNNSLELSTPKTVSSIRTLLMPDALFDALLGWKSVQPQPSDLNLVCTDYEGKRLTSNQLQRAFKRILTESGLPNVRLHDLRHSYATLMLQSNVQSKIVCEILGHSSIDVTLDIYSHVLTGMQKPAVDAINTVLLSSQLDSAVNKNA